MGDVDATLDDDKALALVDDGGELKVTAIPYRSVAASWQNLEMRCQAPGLKNTGRTGVRERNVRYTSILFLVMMHFCARFSLPVLRGSAEDLCIRCLDYPQAARATLVAMTQPQPGPRTEMDFVKAKWLMQRLVARASDEQSVEMVGIVNSDSIGFKVVVSEYVEMSLMSS